MASRAEANGGAGAQRPQETICRKFCSLVGFVGFEFLLLEDFEER